MAVLFGLLWPLERFNTAILALCRIVAMVALGVMVCLILGQVFFRYVLNDAPSWTEEGARFGMLWMTGLMAPYAYRHGGFVSIDMLERALPRVISSLLTLVLLGISLAVLIVAIDKGWNNHVMSLSGNGNAPSLRLPLDWFGGERLRFKNYMAYGSLAVGFTLLLLVNIELILRQLITLLGAANRLTPLSTDAARAD
ncbi:MAG: TRAP transporter small permease [Rhodobacteraceae bacterium]|jgi:TRAP-type C4-dicarboxylate transport system permease small subunit|nr:TRAP transporter small permease [Paracoccaceae bacterium]